MSPQLFYPCEGPQCFPRVSGDEPVSIALVTLWI